MDGRSADNLEAAARELTRGRFREAHARALVALRADPKSAEAHFLLGAIATEHRNFSKAAELFGQAALFDAGAAKHHAHLAKCLLALSRRDEARAAIDRARALAEGAALDALTLDTIGVVLTRLGEHNSAIGFLRLAVERDPMRAEYRYNLAASLQFAGEFESAARAYEEAIRLKPDFFRAFSALVQLEKQTAAKNRIAELEHCFEIAPADPDRARHIGHALAKTYEDMGEWDRSLEWLARAKAPKRAALAYKVETERMVFEAAMATLPVNRREHGHGSSEPIFIVGLPRTGTTLADRILSSHPRVFSAGELTNFALIAKRRTKTSSNLVLDSETLARASEDDLAAIGEAYIASTRPLTGRAAHFTDKMPLNFFYAGLIHRALPNARIVCLRRDPIDSCLSNYRQLFATSFSYYNYALSLEDCARYYALFGRLVAHWRSHIPTDRFLEVRYEDIVADQENATRRLLEFCGLEWDERCLAFHENAAPVATASSVQVRSPIYASSVGRWRRYGEALAPLLAALRAEGVLD